MGLSVLLWSEGQGGWSDEALHGGCAGALRLENSAGMVGELRGYEGVLRCMLRGDLKAVRVLGCHVCGLIRLVQLTCDYYWQWKEYGFTEFAVEKSFMYGVLHCTSYVIDLCTLHSFVPEPAIHLPSHSPHCQRQKPEKNQECVV